MRSIYILVIISIFNYEVVSAQSGCGEDTHTTQPDHGWISCQTAASPNPLRGNSHWIIYDFGHVYTLGQMHIWNFNMPGFTDVGIQNVAIDYSMDGSNWIELGQFTFSEGTGESNYEGMDGPHFQGIQAQYVLITGITNWGNNDCWGLAEIRFDLDQTTPVEEPIEEDYLVELFPNPTPGNLNIRTESFDFEEIRLYDAAGKEILRQSMDPTDFLKLDLEGYADGFYLIKLYSAFETVSRKFVIN